MTMCNIPGEGVPPCNGLDFSQLTVLVVQLLSSATINWKLFSTKKIMTHHTLPQTDRDKLVNIVAHVEW